MDTNAELIQLKGHLLAVENLVLELVNALQSADPKLSNALRTSGETWAALYDQLPIRDSAEADIVSVEMRQAWAQLMCRTQAGETDCIPRIAELPFTGGEY